MIAAKTDFIDNKSVIFMMRVKLFLFAIKLVEIKNQQHLYALFNSDSKIHTQRLTSSVSPFLYTHTYTYQCVSHSHKSNSSIKCIFMTIKRTVYNSLKWFYFDIKKLLVGKEM